MPTQTVLDPSGPTPNALPQANDKPKKKVEWSARVMTGFEARHRDPAGRQSGDEKTDYAFFLQQARVGGLFKLTKAVRAEVSADLADALDFIEPSKTDGPAYDEGSDNRDPLPFLRDAYVNLRAHEAFQVRAGRFKRPFSRLENRSSGALPFRGRGLSNRVIVEEAKWSDRAIGMMLWGEVKPAKLTWYVSVSNAAWESAEDDTKEGANLQGRLEYDPAKWISIGLNGGQIWAKYDAISLPDISHGAAGGDVRVRAGSFYLAAEAIAGQRRIADSRVTDPVTDVPVARTRDPFALGATLYVNYDIPLPRELALQPAAFAEYADSDLDFRKTEAIRTVLGLNLLVGDYLRIMPGVEIVRPLDAVSGGWDDPIDRPVNRWKASETYSLMISLEY